MELPSFPRPARLCLLALCLAVAGADAALTEWRTQVQVSVGSGNGTQFDFDGGLNIASSYQTLSSLTGSGVSEASSELSSGGFVPTLRTRATNAGTRAQAAVWGVQGYTNGSASALDTSLQMTFSATISGSNDVIARLYLFREQGFEFYADSGTMLFESSSQLWPGFESFANNLGPDGFDISRKNFDGPVNEERSFDFTVDPGESFYVWAELVSTADNSGVADAFSTLSASLSNTQGLVPAVVPEPSGALTLLLGSALLWLRRTR